MCYIVPTINHSPNVIMNSKNIFSMDIKAGTEIIVRVSIIFFYHFKIQME